MVTGGDFCLGITEERGQAGGIFRRRILQRDAYVACRVRIVEGHDDFFLVGVAAGVATDYATRALIASPYYTGPHARKHQ